MIGKLFYKLFRRKHRTGFGLGEHDWRQMVTFSKVISYSRFGTNGYSCFLESTDITVYCPFTYFKTLRNVFSPDDTPGLKHDKYGRYPVDPVHWLDLWQFKYTMFQVISKKSWLGKLLY